MSKRIIFTADAALTFASPATANPNSIGTLKGVAIRYGDLSADRGGYRVRLLPDSATFTDNVAALWHHDWAMPLADTTSNTLRILPDSSGVNVEIDLPNTIDGQKALELVRTRRVRGMSFAMTTDPEGTWADENGEAVLNVTRFECDEVTITAAPAFDTTEIELKASMPNYSDSLQLERMRFCIHTIKP